MLLLLLKTLGWLTAHCPEFVLRLVAAVLGDAVFTLSRRRRQLVLSNLHHAFPEKPLHWHHAIGRESCRRMIETGLLSLATPYLSPQRLKTIVSGSPALLAAFAEHRAAPAATLICSPHIAYWEAQTSMALVLPEPFPEFGTIYRPLDNPAVDEFVKRSRSRFGMKLLSRKEGFAEALKILRRQGFVGVLFDQNAGLQGALTTLFGRVCSTTELPGLMAEKFNAHVYGIFPRRLGFWRVQIDVQRISSDGTSNGVTLALNRWLETLLRENESICPSWLWIHSRWRNQDMPSKRFRLEARRNLLAEDLAARGRMEPERRTRIWIRLPNWLGDVVMAVPLIRALRVSRPDAEITLVAKKQFLPLLQQWELADCLHPLPERGFGYFTHFRRLANEFPDVWVLFTNSFRGDLEARLTGCRQRFGIVRPGKRRPLLSHAFSVAGDFDERTRHQLELWELFFRHFGLNAPIDQTPLLTPQFGGDRPIGLIAGSENSPEKRWPVRHWRALIESLPEQSFILFGTAKDAVLTAEIAAGFARERVRDLAGRTDLVTFAARLRETQLLVTNDTGGMHLANALGVSVVGLFGPTNPVRTGPVFSAPAVILQPNGCAPTGGGSLEDLTPHIVAERVRQLAGAARAR